MLLSNTICIFYCLHMEGLATNRHQVRRVSLREHFDFHEWFLVAAAAVAAAQRDAAALVGKTEPVLRTSRAGSAVLDAALPPPPSALASDAEPETVGSDTLGAKNNIRRG